ncbi:MAG: hypothetical protein K2N78_01150 [Oscillospiraceae bacterium]|nr:hypothetical protein [Oscillospiraceae bacterium]
MKTEKRRRFAAIGGLCGAAYLVSNGPLLTAPDILLGLLLGVGLVLMIVGLLPEETVNRLRKWKYRGE